MRRLTAGAAALAATVAGCSDESLCPYPSATPIDVRPATACITGTVETCIEPTLVVTNGCDVPLYLPTDIGRFGPDGVPGTDIEILPTQTARYVIRGDKAESETPDRKEYVVRARLTTQEVEIRFATLSSE